ncbi:hypothetical protein LCGC14_2574140 [marine sediment metagenome]|uniref:Uncharacterized protein n=1 Tax=marine sediment metagenome TaxID=412755 RepID=A0A0F9CSK8_9ZZZZ
MSKQCSERVDMNHWLLICVLDARHAGRHKDADGGTWKNSGLKGKD